MSEALALFRDAAWSFVGVVATVIVTIGVSIWQTRRNGKALQFQCTRRRLIGLRSNMGGRLELLFKGKPRYNIWLITYEFENTGTEPIRAADQERPIRVETMGAAAEILEATIVDCYPRSLCIEIETSLREVAVKPVTLNQGDRFSLTLLVSDFESEVLDYRIAGLREMTEIVEFPRPILIELRGYRLRSTRGALTGAFAVLFVSLAVVGYWSFELGKAMPTFLK